jgi:hypothetical protein
MLFYSPTYATEDKGSRNAEIIFAAVRAEDMITISPWVCALGSIRRRATLWLVGWGVCSRIRMGNSQCHGGKDGQNNHKAGVEAHGAI